MFYGIFYFIFVVYINVLFHSFTPTTPIVTTITADRSSRTSALRTRVVSYQLVL